jgi:hypothetical protein
MKRSVIIILFSLLAILSFLPTGCAPGTVTVGVGVGVAGPWAGPYGYPGGGAVWVGRPVGTVYYHLDPLNQVNQELVENNLINQQIAVGN